MCWAVPSVVLDVLDNGIVVVDMGDGVRRFAVLGISEGRVNKGDLVMVHAGVVITKIDLSTLRESMEMWKQMARELAASTGEDPEAAAKMIEEEMWRVLKIANEISSGDSKKLEEFA